MAVVEEVPAARLDQVRVWPNPASSSVNIGFRIDQRAPVDIRIFDVAGSLVRDVASGQVFDKGSNAVAWDGLSGTGAPAPAGVYFAQVTSAAGRVTRRVILAP